MNTNRSHSTRRTLVDLRQGLSPARLIGALLLALLAFGAAACGEDDSPEERTASSGSCLEEVKDSGYLTSAFDGVPPFSFVSPSGGEVTGLIPDILREFMEREDIPELKALTMPFSSMIPALEVGKIDVNGTEISYTPERATQVTFTEKLYWNPDALVVSEGNPRDIHSLEDGAGLRFGTYSGSIYEEFLREAEKEFDINVTLLPAPKELLAALSAEHLDAGMMDQVGAAYAIGENPELGLELASGYTPVSPKEAAAVHLAFRKPCTDLAGAFDRAWAEMVSDGTRDRILEEWGLTPLQKFIEYNAG